MLNAVFLHDTESDFNTSADSVISRLLLAGLQNDVSVTCDPLKDFGHTKQLINDSDFVITSSTYNCNYEFILIDYLVQSGKPYIKYESGYNFCAKRNALCFDDLQITNCCNSERFTAHRKLFSDARLSVFPSAKHYSLHHAIYGAAIRQHYIIQPADAGIFWVKIKEALAATETRQRWKNVLIYKSFGGLGDFLFAIPAIHKIATVSDKVSVCAPFVLYDLLKKQLPQYEVFREDYITQANLAEYDKVIDLKNYPSFEKDKENSHQMSFPSYRRLKQHAIKHYLDGVATLHLDIDNSYAGYPFFKRGKAKGNYFTVHPGAGFAAKYWPADKYGQLIKMLLHLFDGLECKLISGPGDPKVETLFQNLPNRVTLPKGSLEEIAGEISGALFHIGNDSGITHLAGAFNVPTVSIHGPTGPGTWMSFAEQREVIWGKQDVCEIACNYDISVNCEHRICLNSVTPQRVMRHVLSLMQKVLPAQNNYSYILNPEATIQELAAAIIIKAGGKELLIEFAEPVEKDLFKRLIKQDLAPPEYSASLEQLVDVLVQNGLLFKIPDLPEPHSSPEAPKPTDITLVGHVLKRDSIGRHSLIMGEMLEDAFVINGIVTRRPNPDGIDAQLFKKITGRGRPGKLALFTDVLWHNKTFRPYKSVPAESAIKVCYSMFESTGLPEEWVTIINDNFDGVLVPDKWLIDVYKNCGVVKPLRVLPLACDLKQFLAQPLKQQANSIFTCGISATALARKNILGVINAFQLAFPKENELVKLKIHGRSGAESEIQRIKQAIAGDKRIEIIFEAISDEDYLNFMTSLDAYIMLSMGEGFSVTPREAMALGLPIILSNNTAHTTICESGLVMPVPTLREVPAWYEIFNRNYGSFFVPDAIKASGFMKQMYNNRATLYSDASKRRAWSAQYDLPAMKPLYVKTMHGLLNGSIAGK